MLLAEDVMACLTYSMLTIEDDYFGEQVAAVMKNLYREDPSAQGIDRLLSEWYLGRIPGLPIARLRNALTTWFGA